MEDGGVEAAHLREGGVGVERVLVAAEAVEERLLGAASSIPRRGRVSRSGGVLPGAGPLSPPNPPSPRRKSEKRFVKSGAGLAGDFVVSWSTTSAARPLS